MTGLNASVAEQVHRPVAIFVDARASGESTSADAAIIPDGRSIEIERGDRQAIYVNTVARTESLLANGAGRQQQQEQQHDRAHVRHLLTYGDQRPLPSNSPLNAQAMAERYPTHMGSRFRNIDGNLAAKPKSSKAFARPFPEGQR